MTFDELLDQIDELMEKAFNFPLSGGKCVVDSERVQEIVDDIRLNLPQEIRQARAIVADRGDIIATARQEGEGIVRAAEERARSLVAQEEITKQAQQKATEILSQAQLKAREMRKAANDYVDELMKRTDEALTANVVSVREQAKKNDEAMMQLISELRHTRQNLRSSKNND